MQYSRERAAYSSFKRSFRQAHPTLKRDNKYYQNVRAAYLAQGNTLDFWIRPTPLEKMAAPRMRDAFMMDFENEVMGRHLGGGIGLILGGIVRPPTGQIPQFPKGPRRFEDPQWATMMRQQCEGHSDVTFEQYCEWCLAGGGDEWFQEDEAMEDEQEDEMEPEVGGSAPLGANFYDTYEEEYPGELHYELATFKRRLELYTTRLHLLRGRDPRLELVRDGHTHMYEEYEQHFLGKIREFEANVAALERRLG